MRLIPAYIRGSFVVTFILTLLVVTFVMCVGILLNPRITNLLAVGGSDWLILRIFLTVIPQAFSFSIPVSLLTAALLVFGKFSANGEITAMKACGISMAQIARPPLAIAALFGLVCFQLNTDVVPNSLLARRVALRRLGLESPLQLLEEGRFIRDFPGFSFYLGAKRGGEFRDIIIYQFDERGGVARSIRAPRGTIAATPDKRGLTIDLYGPNVRVDPVSDEIHGPGFFDHFPLTIDVAALMPASPRSKNRSDMTLRELVEHVRDPHAFYPELDTAQADKQASVFRVEISKRLVLAVSCLTFVLLGIPLGTTTHRSESSVGIGLSLLLAFAFYLFTIFGESLGQHPELVPWLIPWLPAAASVVLGTWLIRRHN